MNNYTCAPASRAAAEPAPTQAAAPTADLDGIPWNYPLALLNEFQVAAIRNASVKVLRRERCEGTGPRFRRINGRTVRYRLGDVLAWIEAQPVGGGTTPDRHDHRATGRPRKAGMAS